ncbi:glycogen/starch/alpha-glucan phosphorylase [Marinihelvus fidelis]|uniref:Alpha-1,4 glucan phosphorylase n=1 Tax=Marinihelvus fidelis TaxID=2613842 RepID=A0A5N0T6S5_9GAMM|nr:glycogen/starch/alpha-glucan phosphorylase [Marinihelvus fidelis]
MDADAILSDLTHYYTRMYGRRTLRTDTPFLSQALVHTIRDRLMERWNRTNIAFERADGRRACYLSMEFLMGRLLNNALYSLGSTDESSHALGLLGVELEKVLDAERDAGLGNGGLGRLAACFLDSCATLGLPVRGYGIRYHYGMFRQRIVNGFQIEEPDPWLREGFPWEIERSELARTIRFGGRTVTFRDEHGRTRHGLEDTHDVLAIPFDVPIPGYRNGVVNTLRLWSAAATDEFDLEEFNAGSYTEAVEAKNEAENISMVLYPNTATESGHELRLRQQYFLASASLQDILHDYRYRHGGSLAGLEDKVCFQLNDTHPAIAVAELMRLLMDEHGMEWDQAWGIVRSTTAYTNHTLLPEALETWPVPMFEKLLPRLLEIIYEINARFLDEVSIRWPGDNARLARMSLIDEGGERRVRMAYLAIVGSYSVNGVAELHSRLLREGLFRDFYELWPDKFNNKTNGVTPRRWLAACNTRLAALVSGKIGDGWVTKLDQLEALAPLADDAGFQASWRAVKLANKQRLAEDIKRRTGIELDPAMLFDVQVKRIHEYKRQLLNVLHAVHMYDLIRRGDGDELPPRAIIIGGKAAPGYVMAKGIIKLIGNVARVINNDPAMAGRLQMVFYPDYNVSAMEKICPAADLSEQISTAGKEASGTGNMKFMMNGAITIGTLDGANVEILEAVGDENFFLFGHTVEEVASLRENYDPGAYINADEDFRRVVGLLESGHFCRFEVGVLDAVIGAFQDPSDPWMTAADFRSFIDAQRRVDEAWKDTARWDRMSILNSACSGRFSTDRTMQDYNDDIWRLEPVEPG